MTIDLKSGSDFDPSMLLATDGCFRLVLRKISRTGSYY